MGDYLLAPGASVELDEVWGYYALDLQNPDAADRVIEEIFDAFDKLAQTPGLGHFRSDLAAESLRIWRVRSYLIIYRSEKRPIEIVRVLHGARDIRVILGGLATDAGLESPQMKRLIIRRFAIIPAHQHDKTKNAIHDSGNSNAGMP